MVFEVFEVSLGKIKSRIHWHGERLGERWRRLRPGLTYSRLLVAVTQA
jgi:hypothetical protein